MFDPGTGPPPTEALKYLRPEEVERLRDHLRDEADLGRLRALRLPVRDEALFTVALTGGLRASELAHLTVADLDLGRTGPKVVVRHGKGGKRRDVTLPSDLRPLLKRYVDWLPAAGLSADPTSPLFPGRDGEALTRNGVWRAWTRLLDAAGIEHRPVHAARHTASMALYEATGNLNTVQKHLGHTKSALTLQNYIHNPEPTEGRMRAGVDAAWPAYVPGTPEKS